MFFFYSGARRIIDVFDCDTNEAEKMTMHKWINYYTNEDRGKIKNVTSLEFSHTGLDRIVDSPRIVSSSVEHLHHSML